MLSQTIEKKFADDQTIVNYAKEKLKLPKEARRLQQINYAAQVAQRNQNQRELTDTKVLDTIAELYKEQEEQRRRGEERFIDQICLVGLCVGSRISEIVSVSQYAEAENPHYILVTGVAKA